MKNKKNVYILVLSLSIFTIVSSFFFNSFKNQEIPTQAGVDYTSQEVSTVKSDLNNKIKSLVIKESPVNENTKNVLITLNVFDKSYSIKTEEGVNVYDAMKSISDESFSFKATEHSGLGYFVEEINGVKGTPGKYWIYYVNGKEASVGISNYILKNGDIINWKQE